MFGDATEVLAPLMLLTSTVGCWRRMVPVIALLGLQAGINSMLYLTSFGLIAGCTMVAFIPTPAWEWWLGPKSPSNGSAVLRIRVDRRLMGTVDTPEVFATAGLGFLSSTKDVTAVDAMRKKTDADPQLEWRPPVALAIALLFAGVATGGNGPNTLRLEPAVVQR